MDKPIKLTIGATSKRVDIANVVALTFFNNVELQRQSELDVRMGWRDSELGGTGPAILVGNKKCDFGFGQHAARHGPDLAVLEGVQVERSEQLGRLGKTPDQIFE